MSGETPRAVFDRRYMPAGQTLTEAQWRHVATFLTLDAALDLAGHSFGKSTIRAALIRYLLDADPGVDPQLAAEARQAARWAQEAPTPAPVHAAPRVSGEPPALVRARERVTAELRKVKVGSDWDNVPARVAEATVRALSGEGEQ